MVIFSRFLSRRTLLIFVLLVLIAGTVATLVAVKHVQDQRSKAAGSFYDTFFPYGAFDPGSPINNPTQMTNYINDVTPRGMDSLMQNNTLFSNSVVQQAFTVADQKNFNLIVGPQNELYSQWWNNAGAVQTLANAKQIATPLVAIGQAHPSIKGYNLLDDAGGQPLFKRNLMMQAFKELDPDKVVSYIGGTDLDRYDFSPLVSQPKAVYSYAYPVTTQQAPCVFNRGGSQRDWVDNFRITRQFIPSDIPIWQILQTHQTEKNKDGTVIEANGLRYPTVEELRLQQWLAVGEGAKGIFWFTYSNLTDAVLTHPSWIGWHNNPAFLTEITDLSKRLQPLRPLLVRTDKIDDKFTATGTGRTYVSTLKSKDENRLFVLVVNDDCSDQSITLSSSYVTGQLKNLEDNSMQEITTPIQLRGGDGKLFELVNGNLTTPQPTPGTITNGIQNPSFENLDLSGKPLNWTATSTMVDKTVAHSGTNSLKFQGPLPFSYYWQMPPLQPNKKYMLSFWAKTDNVSQKANQGIGVRYNETAPSGVSMGSQQLTGTHDWTRFFNLFTVPSDFTAGRLDAIAQLDAGETAWIDDIELCEVNASCSPLPYVALQPFTQASPTPVITTIQSYVSGVSYQNTPWDDSQLTTFMKNLADTVITHHAKKNVILPYLQGFIYEWVKINPDRPVQDHQEDAMHDSAWFGNSLASAYRASTDQHFLNLLNNYTLTFFPNLLNNSDTFFVLGLPDGAGKVASVNAIPTPKPGDLVSKGIAPFYIDDGESTYFVDGSKIYGYRTGKYSSLHMQQDITVMLNASIMLTKRDDVKQALKNLALSLDSAYFDEAASNPSPITKFSAEKLLPGDTDIKSALGNLPNPIPTGSFNDTVNPPFGRTAEYLALINNQSQLVGGHLDGSAYFYYQGLLDQDRKPLDDAFAKSMIQLPYDNIAINQLWYGKSQRQPGVNTIEGAAIPVSEKYPKYFADDANKPLGSRFGPQNMFFAAVGLQLLKEFPSSWTRWRDTAFPNDQRVEIRWDEPILDGDLDSIGYSAPIQIDSDVSLRLRSSLDTLFLFIDRPVGKIVPLVLSAKPDGSTQSATLTLNADTSLTAKGRNAIDDLLTTKAVKTINGREQIEIALPYTIERDQKPWANAVDDSRLSLKGANNTLYPLFFLSSPETVRMILEKEVVEGLRFWEFVLSDWKMIPAGFYPQKGKNALWSGGASPDGFSDTGGYSHIINTAAAYKEYLDGKNDWDLYASVQAGSTTPAPSLSVSPTQPLPTPTPFVSPTPLFTPTPQPTNTPFPTPTPSNGRNMNITLLLNGIGNGGDAASPGARGNFTPLSPQRIVTLDFYTNPQAASSATVTAVVTFSSASGNFTGTAALPSSLPDGSYLVSLKTPKYVRSLAQGFITLDQTNTTSSIVLPQATLIVGDSNNDDTLDIFDYNIVADCYSVSAPPRNCTDPNRKQAADLNDDGKVDGTDINLLIRNAIVRKGS